MRISVIPLILLFVLAMPVYGVERVTLDKPVKIAAVKIDKTRVAGSALSYDDVEIEIKDEKGETQTLLWADLDPKNLFAVYSLLLQKGTAGQWVDLGELLWARPDGKEWAEKAFARAARTDASVKERIAAIKNPKPSETETKEPPDKPTGGDGGDDELMRKAGGPQIVGQIENEFWGKLSDEHMAEAVATLKKFGEETKDRVNNDLKLYETKFFLFYSDLDTREAQDWAGLLDKMYARLCEMFGIDKKTNIWRGKAIVFVFRHDADYRSFQQEMHQTDASWSAGMCHGFGDGMVHIAFYRQENKMTFARVLVHESVHGFLHRYRSSIHIPSWINEGLAEVLASELVPEPGRPERIRQRARNNIQSRGSLRKSFFAGGQIQPWQYPVAETLAIFMIQNKRKGYVDFVNGIKDGVPWEKSLEEKYGVKLDRLTGAFQENLGVRATR